MSAFSAAVDIMFLDPNIARDALYRQNGNGGGTPVRVIIQTPDDVTKFNAGRFVTDTALLDVRVSDAPSLCKGDLFDMLDDDGERTGVVYEIIGDAMRDGERLVWKAEAKEL